VNDYRARALSGEPRPAGQNHQRDCIALDVAAGQTGLVVDAQITFEADRQGKAAGLILHQNGINQTPSEPKSVGVWSRSDLT